MRRSRLVAVLRPADLYRYTQAEEILNNPSGGITSPALDGNFVLNAPQPVAAFSDFPFSRSKNTSTREILSRLPSKPQADAAARYYYTTTDWYLHPGEWTARRKEHG